VVQPQVKVALAGTGTGTVTSSPGGINCGATCTATFAPETSVTLTASPAAGSAFGGWTSSNGACTGTSNTCTLTVTSAPTITATFNSTAQGFSFAVTPPTASVPQGGSGVATAIITRVNGFAGAVNITTSGAPNGVTIAAAAASGTDTAATLNITATSAVAVGNYPVTVSATGAGIAGAQTAGLNVQVTSAPGGSGNIALSYANCDPSEVPVWFAAQNGTGAWTRIAAGANNTFTFSVGATGGIATVQQAGTGFFTGVFYGSQADLMALALGSQCRGVTASTGTTHLTGTVTGAGGAAGHSLIAVGGASTLHPNIQGTGFTLDGAPSGRRDLVAAAYGNDANDITSISRIIFRRNVTYTSAIPQLVFFGTEDFIPVSGRVGTNNTGADQVMAQAAVVTANGASVPFVTTTAGRPDRVPYVGLPDSVLAPADVHVLTITATPAGGSSSRLAVLFRHSVSFDVDTVTFGPALNQPTVTGIAASPYLRLRAQLASQPTYNAGAQARYAQSGNSVSVVQTAGYANGAPANWVIDIPDLTSAGYDATWGLKSGTSLAWAVYAAGGNVLQLFGATPVSGTGVVAAGVGNGAATFNRLAPFRGW